MSHEDISLKHSGGEQLAIDPIVVGGHTVYFTLELVGAIPVRGIKFTATTDTGGRAQGTLALQSLPHDHQEEQFRNDLKRFAWLVAEEAAGHGQGQIFVDKFFPLKSEQRTALPVQEAGIAGGELTVHDDAPTNEHAASPADPGVPATLSEIENS